jgi:hypothetical protein
MMWEERFQTQVQQGVATLSFNHGFLNSFNQQMHEEVQVLKLE